MDELKNDSYSWGQFYETLKEMKEKGDDHGDLSLQKCFELVEKLDRITTLSKVNDVLKICAIKPHEIQRFNSPCLDGLFETIDEDSPFLSALRKRHIETCKYYVIKKIFTYGENVTDSIYQNYIVLGCITACEIRDDSFFEFFLSKSTDSIKSLREYISSGINLSSLEQARFLIEKDIIPTEITLNNHLYRSYPYNLDLVKFFVEELKIHISPSLCLLISSHSCKNPDDKYTNTVISLIENFTLSQTALDNLFIQSCYFACFAIVKLFVEKGANINSGFCLFPAYRNDKKIAEFLVEKGIDIFRALIEYSARVYPNTEDEFQIWAREQQVNRACKQIDKLLANGTWDFSKPGPIDDMDCR